MAEKTVDRRQFIGAAATLASGLAFAPRLRSASSQESASPSERIVVGIMGTNGRGTSLAKSFARANGSEVAYICDVDRRAIDKATRAIVDDQERRPEGVADFRRILDDRSVDALVVAAPNHWHAPATILACAAGKHVYVEKPCSHTPREGELMVEASRKHSRVVQMGNQRRSYPFVIEAMEQLRGGVIGRVYHARSGYRNTRQSIGQGKTAEVPDWLDFDLWQGPAPRRPYKDNVVHYNWHWFWHWGSGEIGNNGVHMIDLCRWGLGVDYPSRVGSAGGRFRFNDDQETPDTHVVTFQFENETTIIWEGLSCSRYGNEGTVFHGEKGTLVLTDAGYTIYDP
ncbi:MAG TPA: Gfo/Idh/MocA family oxidoreductase, partial [Planctomycetota bacterium]|nr:Gfo/Idh/MocA family oxidoreductase [Planctomycetota bacterium]